MKCGHCEFWRMSKIDGFGFCACHSAWRYREVCAYARKSCSEFRDENHYSDWEIERYELTHGSDQ